MRNSNVNSVRRAGFKDEEATVVTHVRGHSLWPARICTTSKPFRSVSLPLDKRRGTEPSPRDVLLQAFPIPLGGTFTFGKRGRGRGIKFLCVQYILDTVTYHWNFGSVIVINMLLIVSLYLIIFISFGIQKRVKLSNILLLTVSL